MLENSCQMCLSSINYDPSQPETFLGFDNPMYTKLIHQGLISSLILSHKSHFISGVNITLCNKCFLEARHLYDLCQKLEEIKNEYNILRNTIISAFVSSLIKYCRTKNSGCKSLKEAVSFLSKDSFEYKIYKKRRKECLKEFAVQSTKNNEENPNVDSGEQTRREVVISTVVLDQLSLSASSKLEKSTSESDLQKDAINDVYSHPCSYCCMVFSRKVKLLEHLSICHEKKDHEDSELKLNICPVRFSGSAFKNPDFMKKHRDNDPSGDKSGYCDTGEEIFKASNEAVSNICTFSKCCHFCGDSFTLKSVYESHLRLRLCNKSESEAIKKSKKKFVCNHCSKSFAKKQAFDYHTASHTGEKPYKCDSDSCNKAFLNHTQLEIHKRTHTGEKPYICQRCGHSFSSLPGLSSHLKTHAGTKPYKCKVCEKSFRSAGHLAKHNLIHSGERPFSCVLCQKSFNRKENLRAHQHTHSKVKPHQCMYCPNISFSRASLLRKHLNMKHSHAYTHSKQIFQSAAAGQSQTSSATREAIPKPMEQFQFQTELAPIIVRQEDSTAEGIIDVLRTVQASQMQSVIKNSVRNMVSLPVETSTAQDSTLFLTTTEGQYIILKGLNEERRH